MAFALFDITVRPEQDVVTARQRADQLAELLGFDQSEQTRIATAVSEIVRNAFRNAGAGRVEYTIEGDTEGLPGIVELRSGAGGGRPLSRLHAAPRRCDCAGGPAQHP